MKSNMWCYICHWMPVMYLCAQCEIMICGCCKKKLGGTFGHCICDSDLFIEVSLVDIKS